MAWSSAGLSAGCDGERKTDLGQVRCPIATMRYTEKGTLTVTHGQAPAIIEAIPHMSSRDDGRKNVQHANLVLKRATSPAHRQAQLPIQIERRRKGAERGKRNAELVRVDDAMSRPSSEASPASPTQRAVLAAEADQTRIARPHLQTPPDRLRTRHSPSHSSLPPSTTSHDLTHHLSHFSTRTSARNWPSLSIWRAFSGGVGATAQSDRIRYFTRIERQVPPQLPPTSADETRRPIPPLAFRPACMYDMAQLPGIGNRPPRLGQHSSSSDTR